MPQNRPPQAHYTSANTSTGNTSTTTPANLFPNDIQQMIQAPIAGAFSTLGISEECVQQGDMCHADNLHTVGTKSFARVCPRECGKPLGRAHLFMQKTGQPVNAVSREMIGSINKLLLLFPVQYKCTITTH